MEWRADDRGHDEHDLVGENNVVLATTYREVVDDRPRFRWDHPTEPRGLSYHSRDLLHWIVEGLTG
jgi:hypothetical protein